jgi:hypothetical protein
VSRLKAETALPAGQTIGGVDMSSPPVMEDQAVLLENALGAVRMHTNAMRRCLETPGKLMDALKCA